MVAASATPPSHPAAHAFRCPKAATAAAVAEAVAAVAAAEGAASAAREAKWAAQAGVAGAAAGAVAAAAWAEAWEVRRGGRRSSCDICTSCNAPRSNPIDTTARSAGCSSLARI